MLHHLMATATRVVLSSATKRRASSDSDRSHMDPCSSLKAGKSAEEGSHGSADVRSQPAACIIMELKRYEEAIQLRVICPATVRGMIRTSTSKFLVDGRQLALNVGHSSSVCCILLPRIPSPRACKERPRSLTFWAPASTGRARCGSCLLITFSRFHASVVSGGGAGIYFLFWLLLICQSSGPRDNAIPFVVHKGIRSVLLGGGVQVSSNGSSVSMSTVCISAHVVLLVVDLFSREGPTVLCLRISLQAYIV